MSAVPEFEPMSSQLLGECVTHYATVADNPCVVDNILLTIRWFPFMDPISLHGSALVSGDESQIQTIFLSYPVSWKRNRYLSHILQSDTGPRIYLKMLKVGIQIWQNSCSSYKT